MPVQRLLMTCESVVLLYCGRSTLTRKFTQYIVRQLDYLCGRLTTSQCHLPCCPLHSSHKVLSDSNCLCACPYSHV